MQLLEKVLLKFGHSLGLPSNYTLLKKLGAGAEGEVWLGLDEHAQTKVAVKLIPRGGPSWKLDMARREFSMLAQLGPGHLNIVRPLELVLTSKHLVLITEYVPGGSLSDHLARHALCEDHARYFFKQLLAALAFCHSRKIVYRDIKPANVLITGTQPPFLKLCDFGLADSWVGRGGPCFKSLVGTPGYMAPEIMASFFTGAAELAGKSRDAAAAAAAAAAQAASGAGAGPPAVAATGGAASKQQQQLPPAAPAAKAEAADAASGGGGLRRSASGRLTTKVVSAAAAAAAAAKAAVAAVPSMSRSVSLSSLAAALTGGGASDEPFSSDTEDEEAEAELATVAGYDGEKADVYSLGVLLVVMMLRHMPWNYDSIAERYPLLKAMKSLLDLSVNSRVSWRAATSKSDTLSAPLAALLDTMLEPDPARRASLQQVAQSEWVNMPVPNKLQCALEVLEEQQQQREQRYNTALEVAVAAAAAGSNNNCSGGDAAAGAAAVDGAAAALAWSAVQAAQAAVQQQLDEMIEAAKTVNKGFKLESRLILTQLPRQIISQLQQQQQHVAAAATAASKKQQQQEQDIGRDDPSAAEEGCTAAIITTTTTTGATAVAAAAAPAGVAGVAAGAGAGAGSVTAASKAAANPSVDVTAAVEVACRRHMLVFVRPCCCC